MACQIRRDNKKQITEVKTDKDQDSLLYKELLSEVNALDQSGRKTLQNRLRPWVGRYIDNLSNGDLALGLYKQAFSPNFEGFYGKWRTDKTLPNLDVNGEPRLTSDVREYLFNGKGKSNQDLTQQDSPVGTRESTPSQNTSYSDVTRMSEGEVKSTAEDRQIDTLNSLGNIDSVQREEALSILSQDKSSIHNNISELLDSSGRVKIDQPDKPDDVQFNYIKDRLNSYPENTLFKVNHTIVNSKTGESAKVDLMAVYDKDGQTTIDYFNFFQRDVTSTTQNTPWYLERALQNKLIATHDALIANGVDPNILNRMQSLPIQVEPSGYIKMGEINPIYEEVDSLLPITIRQQSTGDAQIDELLTSLYKQRDSGNYSGSLKKAINYLQSKYSAEPLIWQTGEAIKSGEGLNTQWDNQIKNLDFATTDITELNSYIGKVTDQMDILNRYKKNLDLLRERSTELNVTQNQIDYYAGEVAKSLTPLEAISRDFADKLGNAKGLGDITDPETVVGYMMKNFTSSNKITSSSIQLLSTLAETSYKDASKRAQTAQNKLLKARQDFTSKYGTTKDGLKIIMDLDSHTLHSKISPEFNTQLTEAVKAKDHKWVLDNIDVNAYKAEVNRRYEDAISTAEDIQDPKRRESEIRRIEEFYDLSDPDSEGWYHTKLLSSMPIEAKWYSEQYKNLLKPENKSALDTYNTLIDYNKRAQDLGYLPDYIDPNTFVPWADSTFLEMVVNGKGISSVPSKFLQSITINNEVADYGAVDPISGQPIRRLPRYLIGKIDSPSNDIFSSYVQFSKFVERYGELSKIEDIVKNLSRIEKTKGSLDTDRFGRLAKGGGVRADNRNATLYDNMMDAIIYGHREASDSQFDVYLGKVPEGLRNINKALGHEVFGEQYIGQPISFSRSMDSLVHYTQMKVLSLNPLSSLSNFLGGHYQSLINSGEYFTKTDFGRAEFTALGKNFSQTPEAKWTKAAMDYFLIGEHMDPTEVNIKKARSGLSQEAISDFFAIGLRSGDIAVRYANGLALINNMVVIDGKVTNARDYIRNTPEYQSRYQKSEAERKAIENSFEKQVQELIRTKGIKANSKVVGDELVIDGVDRFDPSVNKQIGIHNDLIEKAIGPMAEYQRRGMNLTAIGRAAMLFKNWVPPLAEQRFGGLKFNTSTEKMEWGRMRSAWKFLGNETFKRTKEFISTIKATEEGVKNLDKFYAETKKDYEEKTGKEFKMGQAEFNDMVRNNLRTTAYDLLGALTMLGAFASFKAVLNDQKEQGFAATNNQKFFLKALDKVRDEVTYFYDPRNLIQIMGTSVFPAARSAQDFLKVLEDTGAKSWGLIFDNDGGKDNIHLTKDFLKLVPGANQLSGLIPIFSDKLGNDLGIRINPPQNFTY